MKMNLNTSCLTLLLLVVPCFAEFCPKSCVCTTTRDGLHRAACSDITEIYKFTVRQKHHNINILDLSHNNISVLANELDRLTEVVTLDLSTNGITSLKKFLLKAKKLVHVNLAHNRIKTLSLSQLPTSVSSLDLTSNLLQDVPTDLMHLKGLEHLELQGNPLDCSCENMMARDELLKAKVLIDAVKCQTPAKLKGQSWLTLQTKDFCEVAKRSVNYLDIMMGDEPIDAEKIGKETTALKSMPLVASNDLEEGSVIKDDNNNNVDEEDKKEFLMVGPSSPATLTEGSGDIEISTDIGISSRESLKIGKFESIKEDVTEEPIEEGSGFEGSGLSFDGWPSESEEKQIITTTAIPPELYTGPIVPLIVDDDTSEYPVPPPPSVYAGGPMWHSETTPSPIVTVKAFTEKAAITPFTRDTTVSEPIRINHSTINEQPSSEDKTVTHKTGTYVCIAIIIILLVGLIGAAIVKGQMRKRRDRRLLRQQKRDVENASKEMVDMNKSLLGKPAVVDNQIENNKKNGKYELVPTHEQPHKKEENGNVSNGTNYSHNHGVKNGSPRDTNQNKSSSKDNNLRGSILHETSFDSGVTSPDSKKDTHSLSSEDIFVPLNDDDLPKANGLDLDVSHPLLNGDQNTLSDFLSPSREYVPVYSPDMGRVRIKLSETPKPKTPVLVTRSRSNAGDIVITPST